MVCSFESDGSVATSGRLGIHSKRSVKSRELERTLRNMLLGAVFPHFNNIALFKKSKLHFMRRSRKTKIITGGGVSMGKTDLWNLMERKLLVYGYHPLRHTFL